MQNLMKQDQVLCHGLYAQLIHIAQANLAIAKLILRQMATGDSQHLPRYINAQSVLGV